MNKLKDLINDYQTGHNLTSIQLVQKLGYRKTTKGLRVLSEFISKPRNPEFQKKLVLYLDISNELLEEAISSRWNYINRDKIANFKPKINVTWTRMPSLLITGTLFLHLKYIEVPLALQKLPLKEELLAVCKLYQEHQLKYFAEQFNTSPSINQYDDLVTNIEQEIASQQEVDWMVGNGFTYQKTFFKCLKFNRECELLPHST